jgi:predicted DNA-binding protein
MGREVTAIRLDARTRARVARVAQRRGKTPSEAMREVIESWVEQEEAGLTPFERIEELVGSFEGPGNLSTQGGRRVADDLRARRKNKGQRKP